MSTKPVGRWIILFERSLHGNPKTNGVIDLEENIQIVFKDDPADSRYHSVWQISF